MSADPARADGTENSATEAVAGLLATAAIFASAFGIAYRPARIIPFAVILALVAARMTTRWSRLAGIAVAATVVCWVLGMAVAVITERPLY